VFYAKISHAAAVGDATVGGPTVGRAGHELGNLVKIFENPDLTPSGQLSPQKARHSPKSWSRMLNPAARWPTNHDRLPVRVIRTI